MGVAPGRSCSFQRSSSPSRVSWPPPKMRILSPDTRANERRLNRLARAASCLRERVRLPISDAVWPPRGSGEGPTGARVWPTRHGASHGRDGAARTARRSCAAPPTSASVACATCRGRVTDASSTRAPPARASGRRSRKSSFVARTFEPSSIRLRRHAAAGRPLSFHACRRGNGPRRAADSRPTRPWRRRRRRQARAAAPRRGGSEAAAPIRGWRAPASVRASRRTHA